jgi:murein DD-endopeptidase MepM/ murein hydrolase activator NlpD
LFFPASAIAAEPATVAPSGAVAGPQQPALERASAIETALGGDAAGEAAASVSDQRALRQREVRAERRRERQAEKRRQRNRRPVHPVEGKVGYGDAMAAFGHARGRPHEGQDVFAPAGTPLLAVRDSVVLESGSDGGRGNWVALGDRKRKLTYVYLHLVEPARVSAGDRVDAGERIGGVGCTGSCSGDHLHFEIRSGLDPYGKPRDPMPFLKRAQQR